MRVHFLGICGTFMAGLAVVAKNMGYQVSGADYHVYPPMSTQLEQHDITIYQGYDEAQFATRPDLVVIGNAMSRGNPAVEFILANNIPYISGPQWLYEHVLKNRWVLAVAGTHGKTTTTSMLAWILHYAGLNPGYLIGGVANNFVDSANIGQSPFFVIEADEYDSAFFDKRSKFLHYHPRTLILNNLEYDHADIFSDLAAIEKQFHHLVRTVPNNGLIIMPDHEPALQRVIEQGCWTPVISYNLEYGKYHVANLTLDSSCFDVIKDDKKIATVNWPMLGLHNVKNALSALIAAEHVGVTLEQGIAALNEFKGVKKRMEFKGEVNQVKIFDDFAHHPSAIKTTLEGLRNKVGSQRIFAIIELSSYTMREGTLKEGLITSVADADFVYFKNPEKLTWDLREAVKEMPVPAKVLKDVDAIIAEVLTRLKPKDAILVMAKTNFDNIHEKLKTAIERAFSEAKL